MNTEWFEIDDLEELVDFSRRIIYFNFDSDNAALDEDEFFDRMDELTEEEEEELNHVLSFQESKMIIKQYIKKKKNKRTKQVVTLMKESDYDDYLNELNHRLVSNMVMEMVKKGILDTAFDDERNDFVFWVKENENEQ